MLVLKTLQLILWPLLNRQQIFEGTEHHKNESITVIGPFSKNMDQLASIRVLCFSRRMLYIFDMVNVPRKVKNFFQVSISDSTTRFILYV